MAALALMAAYDMGTLLPLNDEWQYRWPLEHLTAGQGLQLYPGTLPAALVQLVVAAPLALLHLDPRAYRLTILPFAALAAGFSYGIARDLGANRFWSAVAAVGLVAAPLTMSVATGFQSDIPYLALLMAAAYFGLRWIRAGRGRAACVLVATLAALQRQHAIAIPLAMTVVLIAAPSVRPRLRHELGWLLGLWGCVLAALALPYGTGMSTELMRLAIRGQATSSSTTGIGVIGALLWFGPVTGLLLLPFLIAAVRRPRGEQMPRSRVEYVPVGLALAGLISAGLYGLVYGSSIWPGDVFGIWGLGPLHLEGAKPAVFPLVPFLVVELLAVAVIVVVFIWRRGAWMPRSLGSGGAWLVVLAAGHLGPMAVGMAIDRYYIPVVALLAPLVAAAVTRGEMGPDTSARLGRTWAVAVLAVGLVWFVAGEQDYQSWQVAREAAAQIAYQVADPHSVEAGFEAVGVHAQEPDLRALGRSDVDLLKVRVNNPRLRLVFAGHDDPRPGVTYESVAPGKIVIDCPRPAPDCPTLPPG